MSRKSTSSGFQSKRLILFEGCYGQINEPLTRPAIAAGITKDPGQIPSLELIRFEASRPGYARRVLEPTLCRSVFALRLCIAEDLPCFVIGLNGSLENCDDVSSTENIEFPAKQFREKGGARWP